MDGMLVALGADISHTSKNPLYTTLNQCWQRGEIVTERQGLPADTVVHDGIAYLSLDGQPLQITAEERSGEWQRINHSCSLPPVTGRIFTLTLSHGVQPQNASYAYMVVPSVELTEAAGKLSRVREAVTVLRNDGCVQAVRYGNQVFCVFHQRGSLILSNGKRIESSAPAGYILEWPE